MHQFVSISDTDPADESHKNTQDCENNPTEWPKGLN